MGIKLTRRTKDMIVLVGTAFLTMLIICTIICGATMLLTVPIAMVMAQSLIDWFVIVFVIAAVINIPIMTHVEDITSWLFDHIYDVLDKIVDAMFQTW